MTSSYLGITGHFFSWHDRKCHHVTLAVHIMPHPHNAEHILEIAETVLQEWNIDPGKVQAVLTDNGSNMVKAFREHFKDDDEDEEEEDIDDDDDENEDDTMLNEDEEAREIDHEVTFKYFGKRISCFARTNPTCCA